MKRSLLFFVMLIVFVSCKEPDARRPKQHSTTNFYQEVMEENKRLNDIETKRIEKFLLKDSVIQYKISPNGFWYAYQKRDSINTVTPRTGDIATISYVIKDMNDVVLYPNQKRNYVVDKEDFIPALQDGIKLMKPNETVTFVIPSYKAYGVTGDGNRIGIRQPIKSIVTLIKIQSNTNEN